jgi:tripartite-type tricarboxylate transporter receptor subunit TctC
MRRPLVLFCAFAAIAASPWLAAAADWPAKPVKIIVAYSAGGANDLLARTFGERLSEALGQQFVIENRTGGGGLIGGEAVARADPDGYTLMASGMPSHVIAPAMNQARFDPVRDFTHIAYLGGPPNVFVVHESLPIASFKDLLAMMRSKPEGVEYASPNVGSVGNMVAEYITAREKLKLNHVVYRGGGAAILDVVAGHVKVASMTLSTTLQHIRAGTLRPLAISSARRVRDLPDTPTLTELGYPELVVTTWYSLSGPKGLPKDIVDRLNAEVNKAMDDPRTKALLEQETVETRPMTPAEFSAFMAAEVAKWAPTIRAMKTK